MASFASSATAGDARKHAWTNYCFILSSNYNYLRTNLNLIKKNWWGWIINEPVYLYFLEGKVLLIFQNLFSKSEIPKLFFCKYYIKSNWCFSVFKNEPHIIIYFSTPSVAINRRRMKLREFNGSKNLW